MTDAQLMTLIVATLAAGLTEYGVTAAVKQAYQPTSQGANTGPTIYVYKEFDKRYGSPKRTYVDGVSVQEQQMESTFMLRALVKDRALGTASDLANTAAAIMQGDSGQAQLWAAGVGVLRVMQISNPYSADEYSEFEGNPLVSVVLTHKRVFTSVVPMVDTAQAGIYRS